MPSITAVGTAGHRASLALCRPLLSPVLRIRATFSQAGALIWPRRTTMEEREQGRYKYVSSSEGNPLISTHTIVVATSRNLKMKACLILLLPFLLFTSASGNLQWMLLLVLPLGLGLLFRRGSVRQEAVMVMPSLGVQLETVYGSGKVLRRFVPMHRILAAVINEAVTPTHCYFYLALVLRGEGKLTLAFKETRPPLDMLLPAWRCLCNAIGPDPFPDRQSHSTAFVRNSPDEDAQT